jgi:predicted ATPase
VEAVAAQTPTVLVFEDLHWADPSLLDLIEHLASRVRETPLMLVGLTRAELLQSRPSWGAGLPAYTSVPLEPLDDAQSRELARVLLARATGDGAHAVERLAELSEGNPLFLEELAHSLVERATDALEQLPTTIRGIVAARLDALPGSERAVLLDAAVMGRFFWRGGLERLTQHPELLPQVLDSLEEKDVIRRDAVSVLEGQEQFRFKHMLIRDVAYGTLPRSRRRDAHAAVAEFLEQRMVTGEAAAALAHHWQEAGRIDRARQCYLDAAELASRGWAKVEAVRLYREALKLAPEDDAEQRRAIRMRLAIATAMVFHLPDVERLRSSPGGKAPPS